MIIDQIKEIGTVKWAGTSADLERGVQIIWKMNALSSEHLFTEVGQELTWGHVKDED